MFNYFIDYYGSFNPTFYLSTLLGALACTMVFIDFEKSRSMFYKIPISLVVNYALSSLFSAFYYWLFPDTTFGYFINPLFYTAASYILHSLYYRKFIASKAMKGLLVVCTIICLPATLMPITLIEMSNEALSAYRPITTALQYIIVIAGCAYFNSLSYSKFKKLNFFSIFMFFLVCGIGYIIDGLAIMFLTVQTGSSFSYNFYLCLCLLILDYITYYLCYLVNKTVNQQEMTRLENERIKRELEMLKSYELGYEQVRMVKHDIEGQYAVINAMLKAGQYDKAVDYFDELKIMVSPVYQNVYSDNRIVNLALNLANEKAKKHGAAFNVQAAVPNDIAISNTSLTSVMNNLLSNCVDAVSNLDDSKKTIDVAIVLNDNFLTIRTMNHFDDKKIRTKQNGDLLTSKKDNEKHGYGFQIIKKIASSEGGMAKYSIEGDLFIVDVLMQTGYKHENSNL